jgi:hypothetical protein
MTGFTLPDRSTVPALLRASLRDDEAGARVLVDTNDAVPLIFALVAWATVMRGGADFASVEEFDAYLAEVQRRMAEEP